MSLLRRLNLSLAVVVAITMAAPSARAEDAVYITAREVDLTVLLPPPPPSGSALDRAEVDFVAATQGAASPERIALAQHDANETVFDMFTPVLGPRFSAEAMPRTAAMFARIGASEDATLDPVKGVFARIRPWLASPQVKGIAPTSKSGSYPSGHTTRVTIAAIMLQQILPERRTALWERANEYAESRIVLGMHYPLDLEAGRRSGTAIAQALLQLPEFRADLEAARVEIRAGLGL